MVCLVATRWQGSTITTVRRQVNTEQSHQYHNQLGLGTHIMAPSHTQPAQPVVSAAMSSRQPQPGSSSYLMYGCSLTCSLVTKYFSVYNELFSQCGCECGVHISPAGAPLTRVRRAAPRPGRASPVAGDGLASTSGHQQTRRSCFGQPSVSHLASAAVLPDSQTRGTPDVQRGGNHRLDIID